jgi:hypothetical protein
MQDKRHNTVGVIIALAIIAGCIVGIIYASKHREETPKTEAPKYSAVQLLRNLHKGELTEWDVLQLAIMFKESRFNPNAVGSANDRGVYQITLPYMREANRLSGRNYTHDDAFDIRKSIEMFAIVQGRYNQNKDIHEAIKHHNPGAGAGYEKEILRNMQVIRRYENARKLLIEYGERNLEAGCRL